VKSAFSKGFSLLDREPRHLTGIAGYLRDGVSVLGHRDRGSAQAEDRLPSRERFARGLDGRCPVGSVRSVDARLDLPDPREEAQSGRVRSNDRQEV